MSDLTDFLLARIAEDEAVAQAATAGPWWHDPTKWNAIDHEESVFTGERGLRATCVASTGPESAESMADADHIARHDTARVLAECEAKRRIVATVAGWRHEVVDDCWYTCAAATEEREGETCCDDGRRGGECDCGRDFRVRSILAPLALPYADHPDYRDEWR